LINYEVEELQDGAVLQLQRLLYRGNAILRLHRHAPQRTSLSRIRLAKISTHFCSSPFLIAEADQLLRVFYPFSTMIDNLGCVPPLRANRVPRALLIANGFAP